MIFCVSYMIVLSAVFLPSLEALSDECSTSFSSLEVGGEGVWLHCYPARTIIGGISYYTDQIWERGPFPTMVFVHEHDQHSLSCIPPRGKVL